MIPTIVLSNKGNGVIDGGFVLYIYYNADTWLFMDKMQVKIDGTVYDCSVVPLKRDIQSGYISEALVLPINPSMGSTSMTEMMTSLLNTTEEIRIRFGGDKGNVDFTLPDNIHREIIDIYSLYNQACGLGDSAE